MSFFTFGKLGRALLLSGVVAVSAVCWAGCGGDDGGNNNPANNNGNNNNDNGNNNNGVGGTSSMLTDSRDGQTYKTVKIGTQTWMAENLNYQMASVSWCYGDSAGNCAKYGRLYVWYAAMTACPSGWHLPTRDEWGALAIAARGTGDYGTGGTAGKALKSKSGWNRNGNGTDSFGFSALPSGYRNFDGSFYSVGDIGMWWTATEDGVSGNVYYRGIATSDHVLEAYLDKGRGLSLRCVKND